jgi:hypothetical protein
MLTKVFAKPRLSPRNCPVLSGWLSPGKDRIMTTKFPLRMFADDAGVRRIGEALLDRSLPRADWTHEAHLAVCLWLVRERADIALEAKLPDIIRAYNESVGGVNDDAQGYHETLTQFYLAEVRAHHAATTGLSLVEAVNSLLAGPRGARDWPLHFYTRERLFSVSARRYHMPPDRHSGESAKEQGA